ncbi:MAG: septum formation initiator family protein [bacterium]
MLNPSWKTRLSLIGLGIAWLVLIFLIYRLVDGPAGWKANQALESRISAIESEIERLERENEILRREILYRRSNDYLEELARTELKKLYPGEIMVFFTTPVPE